MAKRKRKRTRPPLDDRHRLAIELLTSVPTPNLEDIAKACGVDRRTLYRWRLRQDFQREIRKVQAQKTKQYLRRMKRTYIQPRNVNDFEKVFKVFGLIP